MAVPGFERKVLFEETICFMLLWLPLANRGTGLKSNKTNFLACITVFDNVVPNQPLCSRWVHAVIISGDITVQLLG